MSVVAKAAAMCDVCATRPAQSARRSEHGRLCNPCYKRLVWRPNGSAAVERERALARALKETYRGTCEQCGGPTTGCNGPGSAPKVCIDCLTWTPEAIILALQEWVADHGHSPTIEEARPAADLPGEHAVQRCFGTWNAGLVAAGLRVNRDRARETSLAMADAIRAGESTASIAERYGCTPNNVHHRVRHATGQRVNELRRTAAAFDDAGHPDAAPMSKTRRDSAVPDGAQSAAPPSEGQPSR